LLQHEAGLLDEGRRVPREVAPVEEPALKRFEPMLPDCDAGLVAAGRNGVTTA
jgi:hypothetical protein